MTFLLSPLGPIVAIVSPGDTRVGALSFECKMSPTLLDALFTGKYKIQKLNTFISIFCISVFLYGELSYENVAKYDQTYDFEMLFNLLILIYRVAL